MDIRDERRLMRMMAAHGIEDLETMGPWGNISLSLGGPLHPEIRASQAGRFTLGSADRTFPRYVQKGELLACLGIGALLIPIAAKENGLLLPPLLTEGSIAGYDDVLF